MTEQECMTIVSNIKKYKQLHCRVKVDVDRVVLTVVSVGPTKFQAEGCLKSLRKQLERYLRKRDPNLQLITDKTMKRRFVTKKKKFAGYEQKYYVLFLEKTESVVRKV